MGYEGGINLYTYVGNNPINKTDPQGLFGEGVAWAILQNFIKRGVVIAELEGTLTFIATGERRAVSGSYYPPCKKKGGPLGVYSGRYSGSWFGNDFILDYRVRVWSAISIDE